MKTVPMEGDPIYDLFPLVLDGNSVEVGKETVAIRHESVNRVLCALADSIGIVPERFFLDGNSDRTEAVTLGKK